MPPDIRGAAAGAAGSRLRPARGAGNRAVRLVRGANIGGPRALADSSSGHFLVDRRRRSGSRGHSGYARRDPIWRSSTDRSSGGGRTPGRPADDCRRTRALERSSGRGYYEQRTGLEWSPATSRTRDGRGASAAGDPTKPDVAIVTTQAQAIARYLALVRKGAIDSSALADPNTIAIAAPDDLVIAPISVEALPVRNVERGTGPGVE